jgi:hypothetical protein
MKFLILLFSFSALASNHRGNFTAQEVEPILVWEYVSATCAAETPYECGSDEWVRKGSRPLYTLEVEYDISFKGEASDHKPLLTGARDIDTNFNAQFMLATFFTRPDSQLLIYAQNTEVKVLTVLESSVGMGKKRIKFTSDWTVLSPKKVNDTFEQTIIVDENELHFSQELTQLPLALTICVGQDRRLSRTVKHIGCQDIKIEELKAGTVKLKEINFSAANRTRNLVYFFNWHVTGTWLAGTRGPGPFVVVERK